MCSSASKKGGGGDKGVGDGQGQGREGDEEITTTAVDHKGTVQVLGPMFRSCLPLASYRSIAGGRHSEMNNSICEGPHESPESQMSFFQMRQTQTLSF